MRSAHWILLAFGAACGGSSEKTCFEWRISYSGARDGPVYFREVDARGGIERGHFSSIADALVFHGPSPLRGENFCWSGDVSDVDAIATAWIDLTGSAGASCDTDDLVHTCAPQSSDPQGQVKFVMRAHEYNRITIEIVDR